MDKDSIIATCYKSKKVMIEAKWVLIKDQKGKPDPVLLACSKVFPAQVSSFGSATEHLRRNRF